MPFRLRYSSITRVLRVGDLFLLRHLGDQNASKDMQKFIASVDELHRATSALVAAIHHSGWEGDRGKGAIDLDGAIDASFGVNVTGKGESKSFVLECTGANDAHEAVITGFRLESVALGKDADGNETTAPVLVQAKVTPVDGSNLKSNADKVLDALLSRQAGHNSHPMRLIFLKALWPRLATLGVTASCSTRREGSRTPKRTRWIGYSGGPLAN